MNIIFLYLLDGDIGNGDNVVNYCMDGNVMPITWWQDISTSPTPSLWIGCYREYFWSGSPAPPRSDQQDHGDKDVLKPADTNASADDPSKDKNNMAWWCLTSMSSTFSRE